MNAAVPRVIACLLAFAMLGGQASTTLTAFGRQSAKVASPEVGPDRRVTFRVYAPTATRVEVVQFAPSPSLGSQRDAVTLAMTRAGDVWTALPLRVGLSRRACNPRTFTW